VPSSEIVIIGRKAMASTERATLSFPLASGFSRIHRVISCPTYRTSSRGPDTADLTSRNRDLIRVSDRTKERALLFCSLNNGGITWTVQLGNQSLMLISFCFQNVIASCGPSPQPCSPCAADTVVPVCTSGRSEACINERQPETMAVRS
jgi:hypothetical protein